MKARVVRRFDDLVERVSREVGDVFELTAERLEQINAAGYGTLVEPVEPKKQAKKATAKKAAKKDSEEE